MVERAFYYEAEPDGGYTAPSLVAYYSDYPDTMTIFSSDHEIVVSFMGNGGTIEPYEPPDAALDEHPRQTIKDAAAALARDGDFEAALTKILELI